MAVLHTEADSVNPHMVSLLGAPELKLIFVALSVSLCLQAWDLFCFHVTISEEVLPAQESSSLGFQGILDSQVCSLLGRLLGHCLFLLPFSCLQSRLSYPSLILPRESCPVCFVL